MKNNLFLTVVLSLLFAMSINVLYGQGKYKLDDDFYGKNILFNSLGSFK